MAIRIPQSATSTTKMMSVYLTHGFILYEVAGGGEGSTGTRSPASQTCRRGKELYFAANAALPSPAPALPCRDELPIPAMSPEADRSCSAGRGRLASWC